MTRVGVRREKQDDWPFGTGPLLPCPFCGSGGMVRDISGSLCCIACIACPAEMYAANPASAAAAWNRRVASHENDA